MNATMHYYYFTVDIRNLVLRFAKNDKQYTNRPKHTERIFIPLSRHNIFLHAATKESYEKLNDFCLTATTSDCRCRVYLSHAQSGRERDKKERK